MPIFFMRADRVVGFTPRSSAPHRLLDLPTGSFEDHKEVLALATFPLSRQMAALDHTAAVGVLLDWVAERIARGELAAVGRIGHADFSRRC